MEKIKNYFIKTLAIKKTNRTAVYDYIRVLAVILVITFHVLNWDLKEAASLSGTGLYNTLDGFRWWTLICNMLFIMISGALLLPSRDENVLTFYRKRVIRIVIPLIVYYIFYLWQYQVLAKMSIKEVVIAICTADLELAHVPHFWLIYEMLIIYLMVPFLRTVLEKINYMALTTIVSLTVIYLTVGLFTGLYANTITSAIGWVLTAIAGYWMSRPETRKYDFVYMTLGIVGTVYMLVINDGMRYFEQMVNSLSLLRFCICLGIFAIFFRLSSKLKNIYFIRLISKYSYGIMLIHMWSLYFVTRKICSLSSVEYKGLGLLISVVITLAVSLITAYVIDNTVVALLTKLFSINSNKKAAS